jgi:hypothetical protein
MLIVFFIFSQLNKVEGFENENNVEIVVARYNESLDFLKNEPFNQFPIIIYNKGINDNFYKPPLLKKVYVLPNVGVCVHTFFHHIIENYDNLPKITIFLPGSCMDEHKKDRTLDVLKKTIETNNSVIHASRLNADILNDSIYNFTLDNWPTTNKENKQLNGDSTLRKCHIKPFGKWFENVFGNISINDVTTLGIFSVSREHIQNREKTFYEKIIQHVENDKNEECAHYIERSYVAIFHPLPKNCIYN